MAVTFISGCTQSSALIKAGSTNILKKAAVGGTMLSVMQDLKIDFSVKTHKPGVYLRQKPEAAHVMIYRIAHEIEAGSKGQFCYRQVVVVIGKLYDDEDKLEDIPFKRRSTITWEHHYLFSDEQPRITRVMDRNISRIVRKSLQELLDKFYTWRVTSADKQSDSY